MRAASAARTVSAAGHFDCPRQEKGRTRCGFSRLWGRGRRPGFAGTLAKLRA
ncbi:hypothetical protein EKH55_1113 [Sinorhizobium alkalisoli]|nr:hypothetical protein EKH55_1113 [Sinorhizobium alkalisoli]